MNEPNIPKCPRCGGELAPSGTGDLCPRCAAALLQATQTDVSGDPQGKRAFDPPSVAELAPLFPQFEILELLGRGGMGAVYKARQKELDRVVALKILPVGIGEGPAFAERFAREAKALARLNHPGIVTIHDFGRAGDLYYFLMEFVDGVTLRRLLEGGRVSPREALAIVPQICDALQYAHDEGIVHRDIKPENILLDRRGRVKVADFGLAKLVGSGEASDGQMSVAVDSSTLTQAGKVMGTPAYMAPEQEESPAEVDHRADIYALGVVFYQMLTGELPSSPMQPPSKKVHIDVRLDQIVLQALEREPGRRYQHASQVKAAVETITAGSGNQAEGGRMVRQRGTDDSDKRSATPRRWWPAFLAGFMTLVLLEFGAIALATKPDMNQFVLGFLAVGVALTVLFSAKKSWLSAFLWALVIAFLLWLGVAATVTDALPLGVGALILACAVGVFVVKKVRPPRAMSVGFGSVFLLVFGASVLITQVTPDTFVSIARVAINSRTAAAPVDVQRPQVSGGYDPYLIQTELEIMGSEPILGKVIENLGLLQEWSRDYGRGQPINTSEALLLLKTRLELRPLRNTTLVEIRVVGHKAREAASIANEITKVYLSRRYEHSASTNSTPGAVQVVIVDSALPALRPVRPNKPLNLLIGALAGVLLGIVGGVGGTRYADRSIRDVSRP